MAKYIVPDHLSDTTSLTVRPLIYGRLYCSNCGCKLGRHDNISDGLCDVCVDELSENNK